MAYKLSKYTDYGMEYNYWIIKSFNVFWVNDEGFVDVIFESYINEEARKNDKSCYSEINQQIPFDIFMKKISNISNFEYNEIKEALYKLKEYYAEFRNSEDLI